MRTLQRMGAVLLTLAVTGGLVACGSDDTTDAAGGKDASFCDAVLAFNKVAFETDINDETPKADIVAAGDKLIPLFKTVADEAPAKLSASADELYKVLTPLADGDAKAFNEDATFEKYLTLVGGAIDTCDYNKVDVSAKDYAFTAPDKISSGDVAFSFTNTSKGEDHEMAIMRKAAGVTLSWEELLALPEEEARTKTEFVTAAFAPPGEHSATLGNLKAGSYVMVCFIPVGGKDDGPPHFTQGMIHEFTVS